MIPKMNIKVVKTCEDPLSFVVIRRYPNHGCELIKQALKQLNYNIELSRWTNTELGTKIPGGFLTISHLGIDKAKEFRGTKAKFIFFDQMDEESFKPPTSK